MAYPSDPLPVVVQIAPGADLTADPSSWPWEDVTESALVEGAITYSEGRGEWGAAVDAGAGTAVFLNNGTGDFSEDNPLGRWYGRLGRDTPMRFRFRRGLDGFDRSVAAGFGQADSGQDWEVTPPVDFAVTGGVATVAHPALDDLLHTALLGVDLLDCEQTVDVSPSALLTGGALVVGFVFRVVSGDQYWARCEFDKDSTDVILKIAKRVGGVETQLAVLDPVPGLAYAAGQWLRVCAGIAGDRIGIMVWDPDDDAPGWQLQVTDDDAALARPGRAGVQTWLLSTSTNTLPVVASFRGYRLDVDLWGGYVPAWLPTSDLTGRVRTVPVTGRGVLSRLQPSAGTSPTLSPFRRTITSDVTADRLLAYWPCEDGESATQAASGLPGGAPMTATNVDFAADVTAGVGTAPLASLASHGTLAGTVPAGSSSPIEWAVQWVSRVHQLSGDGTIVLAGWDTPGATYTRWEVRQTGPAGQVQVVGIDAANTEWMILSTLDVPFATLTNWRVDCRQSGGSQTVRLWIGGNLVDSGSGAATVARITQIALNPNGSQVTGVNGWQAGHARVWDTADPPTLGYSSRAQVTQVVDSYGETIYPWWRWDNEAAHDRLARQCEEARITISIPPVAADGVTRMGPQPDGILRDLLRQCEEADGGVLHERPYALAYTPREALYNQEPALILDAAEGDLADAPTPDRENQAYRTRYVVERVGGSSAIAELADAATGIVYEDSAQLYLASDDMLKPHAWWRLHLASTPGRRWPHLSLNLLARPDLIDAWLNCRVGSRVKVVNPHEDYAGQDIDVLLEGWTVTLGHKELSVSANCSPARPWQVGEYGQSRYDTQGSDLAAAVDADDTTLLVATTAGPVWTTDPDALPVDLAVGGERMTATAIEPAVSDEFGRVETDGWGTADSGQTWTISQGLAQYISVDGAHGVIAIDRVNAERHMTVDIGYAAAQAVRLWATLTATPSGAPANYGVLLRYVDANNYYWIDAQVPVGGGSIALRLVKRVGGVATQVVSVATSVAHSSTVPRVIRAEVVGSRIRGRIWSSDTAEPTAAWAIDATDTDLTAGTRVGAVTRLMSGNTNPLPVVIAFDEFAVTTPQRVTVTRSVNGVSRSWPAGTRVRLWEPAVYALGATGPAVDPPAAAAGDIIDLADYPGASGPYVRSADVAGAVAGQTIVAEG